MQLNVHFDEHQYRGIVDRLDQLLGILKQLVIPSDDPAKLAALTAELKKSGDALQEVVAEQPQPPTP